MPLTFHDTTDNDPVVSDVDSDADANDAPERRRVVILYSRAERRRVDDDEDDAMDDDTRRIITRTDDDVINMIDDSSASVSVVQKSNPNPKKPNRHRVR